MGDALIYPKHTALTINIHHASYTRIVLSVLPRGSKDEGAVQSWILILDAFLKFVPHVWNWISEEIILKRKCIRIQKEHSDLINWAWCCLVCRLKSWKSHWKWFSPKLEDVRQQNMYLLVSNSHVRDGLEQGWELWWHPSTLLVCRGEVWGTEDSLAGRLANYPRFWPWCDYRHAAACLQWGTWTRRYKKPLPHLSPWNWVWYLSVNAPPSLVVPRPTQ